MKDKYCGNCKHFNNEDVEGWGTCEFHQVTKCYDKCSYHSFKNNGWTEISPDNVEKIKSVESNRVIICASNGIGYMYPLTLLSLECSLESIADYGGHYYFVLPELKIE